MRPILSFIYNQGLTFGNDAGALTKLWAKCARVLRRLILRVADPSCRMEIWGRPMWMPFSHELPTCLARDRHYDQVLKRVTDFVRASRGAVCGIDVGANIGDTIAASIKDGADRFLGIEPNPIFFRCLTRNFAGFSQVRLLNTVCSTADGSATYRITTARGTASFEESDSEGMAVQTNQLDTIVTQFPEFGRCNFLKIDTDGHDFDVLRSAKRLIAETKPAILFECEIRDNPNYVEDVLEAISFFKSTGFRHALVYDNCGELFGILELHDKASFLRMLFYQVTGGRCNFDILVMQNAETFIQSELAFFANASLGEIQRMAAHNAARLIWTEFAGH